MVKLVGISTLGVTGVIGICGGAYALMREKTIGDRVRKTGLFLIKSGDSISWKFAAKHLKLSDTDLVKDLSPIDSEIKAGSIDLDKAKVALEKWCLKASSKDLSEQNIRDYLDKVKSRCTSAPFNIKEKLKRENKEFTGNWGSKFEILKGQTTQDSDLENHLKAFDNTISESVASSNNQKSLYSSALQKWCESKLDLKLEDNDFETVYPKIISRCI